MHVAPDHVIRARILRSPSAAHGWDFAEANLLRSRRRLNNVELGPLSKSISCQPTESGEVEQLDATHSFKAECHVLQLIHPTTTTSVMLICRIFSMSGCAGAWQHIIPISSARFLVPKKQELVATPYRFEGSNEERREFFERGLSARHLRGCAAQHIRPTIPLTVFYAFKQSEADETMKTAWSQHSLNRMGNHVGGLLQSGFQVTGTWPMRSELSSAELLHWNQCTGFVDRSRLSSASRVGTDHDPKRLSSRSEEGIATRAPQPAERQHRPGRSRASGHWSRHGRLFPIQEGARNRGSPMRVRTALALINQGLDEVLSELESEFDPDTRWALAWFEQHQFEEGLYGEAEVLATAKALSVSHLAETRHSPFSRRQGPAAAPGGASPQTGILRRSIASRSGQSPST